MFYTNIINIILCPLWTTWTDVQYCLFFVGLKMQKISNNQIVIWWVVVSNEISNLRRKFILINCNSMLCFNFLAQNVWWQKIVKKAYLAKFENIFTIFSNLLLKLLLSSVRRLGIESRSSQQIFIVDKN